MSQPQHLLIFFVLDSYCKNDPYKRMKFNVGMSYATKNDKTMVAAITCRERTRYSYQGLTIADLRGTADALVFTTHKYLAEGMATALRRILDQLFLQHLASDTDPPQLTLLSAATLPRIPGCLYRVCADHTLVKASHLALRQYIKEHPL